MKDWEISAEEMQRYLAERDERRLTQRFVNRQRVLEANPRLEAYVGADGLEPPVELHEDDPANPELQRFLGEIAGYHLGAASLVELRHPLSGVETQVAMEGDRILVSLKKWEERVHPDDERTYLYKIRFAERVDGTFSHSDLVRLVEDSSEFQHSTETLSSPATRMELVSMLSLLIESDVVQRVE